MPTNRTEILDEIEALRVMLSRKPTLSDHVRQKHLPTLGRRDAPIEDLDQDRHWLRTMLGMDVPIRHRRRPLRKR